MHPAISKLAVLNSAIALGLVAQVPMDAAGMPQILRELGSFGLVAFIVWYCTTKVLPNIHAQFLAALAQQREDHLRAAEHARTDYLAAGTANRLVVERLVEATNNMVVATQEHIKEARLVWQMRDGITPEDQHD